MPEPITTLTVGAIALYLADKVAGKAIGDSSAALWKKIKEWFKGEKFIGILEEAPDSASQQEILTSKLDELIKQQPDIKKEIENLLNQLPLKAVSNVLNIAGLGNMAFQNVSNSTINASITIGKSGEYREHEEKLDLLKELLDKTPPEETQKRLDLSQKINEQEKLVESFKQDVLKLAETFDRIELNTERLQKAKEYFDKGEITEARVLLEDAEEERADQVVRALVKQKESQQVLQNAATEYLLLAQATALNFENPKRFEDTRRYYEQSVAAFPSFDNLFAYAYFLQEHNQFKDAVCVYERIKKELTSKLSSDDYARSLNNLAMIYDQLNEYEAAEKGYNEALEIKRELAEKDPQEYLAGVAITLNNLAILHRKQNNFETAEKECQEAFSIYKKLIDQNDRSYLEDLAATLTNLANVHRDQTKFEAAEKEYGEALAIRRNLVRQGMHTVLPKVALILNNLAILHGDLNSFQAAEIEFGEALGIYRNLAEKNLMAYLPFVATTLNNLANLYRARNRYKEAEEKYVEALRIRRELATKNPQSYEISIAQTQFNLAFFYQTTGESSKTRECLEEVIQILEKYADEVPYVRKYLELTREALESLR